MVQKKLTCAIKQFLLDTVVELRYQSHPMTSTSYFLVVTHQGEELLRMKIGEEDEGGWRRSAVREKE